MKKYYAMNKIRLSVLILLVASLALCLGACGGKQKTKIVGQEHLTKKEIKEIQKKKEEMTPEQREAARQKRIDDQIQHALDVYTAADSTADRDYAQITKLLKSALKARPTDSNVMFDLGVLAYEQNDVDGAKEWWNKATEANDEYTRGLANLGMLKYADGDVKGAKAIFEKCVKRSQTAPGCNINLALISRNENIKDGHLTRATAQNAIDHLRFALGGDGRNSAAYAGLARVYLEMNQLTLARLVCVNAIKAGIDAAPIHNQLGLVFLAQHKVIPAYNEFKTAVERDPDYLDAWMNIGAMAMSFRDYNTAKNAFQKVLAQKEKLSQRDLVDATLSFGVAERGLGQLDDAEKQYKAVLAIQPNDVRALYNLGVLYQEARSDYKNAVSWYKKVLASSGKKDASLIKDVNQRIKTLNTLIELQEEQNG